MYNCTRDVCTFLICLFVCPPCPGLSTSLVPMYVSEIAPVNLRGGVGIVNQLAVTIGLLLSQVRTYLYKPYVVA